MAEQGIPYGAVRPGWRGALAGVVCAVALVGPTPTQTAIANGETRTLTLHHAHTQESVTVTFRSYGSYDSGALQKLNWLLRDWRRDEPVNMDPRLFDVLWETYRETGSRSPIRVVSAYRSPATNGMLRRRSRAVAKHSQHMLGKAMDFHLPDVSMARVREIGMRLQRGGVGYYPTAGKPFVHLDVGTVRSWPRMPRYQLERLFPDGMTVHLPADGTPLANYQSALAMIQSRGGSAISYADATGPRRSLWAMLFGGEDGEMEESAPVRKGGRGAAGRAVAVRPGAAVQQVAAVGGDSGSVYAIGGPQTVVEPEAPQLAAAPPRSASPALASPIMRGKPQPLDDETPAKAAAPIAVASLETKSEMKLAAVPLPPRRPANLKEEVLVASAAPMPPARPTAFAETTGSIGSAGLPSAIANGTAPQAAVKYAAANVPTPPARPAQFPRGVAPPSAPASAPVVSAAPKKDGAKLNALMADVVQGSTKDSKPEKVPLPSVRQSMSSGIVASKLGDNAPAESGKFARGIITRPLDAALKKRSD